MRVARFYPVIAARGEGRGGGVAAARVDLGAAVAHRIHDRVLFAGYRARHAGNGRVLRRAVVDELGLIPNEGNATRGYLEDKGGVCDGVVRGLLAREGEPRRVAAGILHCARYLGADDIFAHTRDRRGGSVLLAVVNERRRAPFRRDLERLDLESRRLSARLEHILFRALGVQRRPRGVFARVSHAREVRGDRHAVVKDDIRAVRRDGNDEIRGFVDILALAGDAPHRAELFFRDGDLERRARGGSQRSAVRAHRNGECVGAAVRGQRTKVGVHRRRSERLAFFVRPCVGDVAALKGRLDLGGDLDLVAVGVGGARFGRRERNFGSVQRPDRAHGHRPDRRLGVARRKSRRDVGDARPEMRAQIPNEIEALSLPESLGELVRGGRRGESVIVRLAVYHRLAEARLVLVNAVVVLAEPDAEHPLEGDLDAHALTQGRGKLVRGGEDVSAVVVVVVFEIGKRRGVRSLGVGDARAYDRNVRARALVQHRRGKILPARELQRLIVVGEGDVDLVLLEPRGHGGIGYRRKTAFILQIGAVKFVFVDIEHILVRHEAHRAHGRVKRVQSIEGDELISFDDYRGDGGVGKDGRRDRRDFGAVYAFGDDQGIPPALRRARDDIAAVAVALVHRRAKFRGLTLPEIAAAYRERRGQRRHREQHRQRDDHAGRAEAALEPRGVPRRERDHDYRDCVRQDEYDRRGSRHRKFAEREVYDRRDSRQHGDDDNIRLPLDGGVFEAVVGKADEQDEHGVRREQQRRRDDEFHRRAFHRRDDQRDDIRRRREQRGGDERPFPTAYIAGGHSRPIGLSDHLRSPPLAPLFPPANSPILRGGAI